MKEERDVSAKFIIYICIMGVGISIVIKSRDGALLQRAF